jgi:hypothetical protein
MELDAAGTYLKIKKVSIDGKVSEAKTIAIIDEGRNTGVPQLEIMKENVFLVWTNVVKGKNQLKTVKLNSKSFY